MVSEIGRAKGPKMNAIPKWEQRTGEKYEVKLSQVVKEASDFLIGKKVIETLEMSPPEFYQQLQFSLDSYILNSKDAAPQTDVQKQRHRQAAGNLRAVKDLIDSIGAHEVSLYTRNAKLGKRPTINIFSKSILESIDYGISFFEKRAERRPGPKPRYNLDLAVECAVEAFEAAARRNFVRNFRIQGKMSSLHSDFVTVDAIFVEKVLKAIDPSITKSNIKTALLKLPPRRSGDQ